MGLPAAHSPSTFFRISICNALRPRARSNCLIRRSCSSSGREATLLPPKRSLRTLFHFIFPAIVKIRRNLILPAGLGDVAALQTLQNNLPLLFCCPLYPCFSFHEASSGGGLNLI